MPGLAQVWVYLQTTPLFGLASTLLAWQAGVAISRRLRGHALANPMLIAVVLLAVLLLATGLPYTAYFAGGQYVQVLLGPATVALAVPMHDNLREVRKTAHAILPAILAGSVVAAVSAMLIARWLGAPAEVVLSMGPKSVTTPIAMGISEQIGGVPSLTAVFVLLTGLVGVVILGPVMRLLRIVDWRAHGLGAGTAAHGLATARVILINETAGAFGGLAIGINGIVTSLILPILAAAGRAVTSKCARHKIKLLAMASFIAPQRTSGYIALHNDRRAPWNCTACASVYETWPAP